MTESQKESMWWKIDSEGFDYYFRYYGAPKLDDEKFNELVKKYREAANELEEYVKPDSQD